jgi:hypothetical protein
LETPTVYAAALAALPLIQKAEQGLASRVANGVAGFLATPGSSAGGQNTTAGASAASAKSTQSAATPAPASTLSTDVANAILSMQDSASGASPVGGHHHHHHHGAAGYKSAASMASDLADQTLGQGSSASAPAASGASVTA